MRTSLTPGGKARDPLRKKPHPTSELLVSTVIELMQDRLPEDISVDLILDTSGISKGSLYHHFEDLADLLETAMVRQFSHMVDSNIALMRQLLSNAGNSEEFFRATVHFNALTQAPERSNSRFERARLLGFAYASPRFAAKLEVEQDRLTGAYAEMFQIAQSRGWMTDDFDPRAAAVLIQAYTLGKVVDDVASAPVPMDEWNSLIMKVVTRVFGAKPD